jgi:hypothetical protein
LAGVMRAEVAKWDSVSAELAEKPAAYPGRWTEGGGA